MEVKVAIAPLIINQSESGPPNNRSVACAITRISTAAQPTHCAIFKIVGAQEPFPPKSPLINTIVGAPVSAPIFATPARAREPKSRPAIRAVIAAVNEKSFVPRGCKI